MSTGPCARIVGVRFFAVMVLVGCESAAPPPPTPIVPTPVDAPSPPPPIDAAPAVVDLDCFVNGPKEYQRVKTDHATMKGLLERITAGPVPDRAIRYVARAAGPATFELVFAGYEPGDYHRLPPYKPTSPREIIPTPTRNAS